MDSKSVLVPNGSLPPRAIPASRPYAYYTFREKLGWAVAVALLLAVALAPDWIAGDGAVSAALNACVVDRAFQLNAADIDTASAAIGKMSSPLLRALESVPDNVLNHVAVACMWLTALGIACMASVRSRPAHRRWAPWFELAFAVLWFHASYWFLYVAKAWLGDVNCNSARAPFYPNGVSGHYAYFGFCSLGLPVFFAAHLQTSQRHERRQNEKTNAFFSALYLVAMVYALTSSITLYRTYAHGYHSARQVLLGVATAILSHVSLLEMLGSDTVAPLHKCAILALFTACGFMGTRSTWPVEAARGPAIGNVQLLVQVSMWSIVILCASMSGRKEALD
ncbi:hypothetical protein FVE85_9082 [Porphyridium purpureum]|uniref:Uncharacterized protein n=1 Tax=Porphyridium purpureum TaxID=35688 RepID=A0A5J4YPC0_PORPP|nr:hypothetical protein FVE85_9082 [Porphyridium purpureum]|eukprot:POR8127..scf222_8